MNYFIFLKVNNNYVRNLVFPPNQLILYPESQFNTFQLSDILPKATDSKNVFKGTVEIDTVYQCFSFMKCKLMWTFHLNPEDQIYEFNEFVEEENKLNKKYYKAQGVALRSWTSLVNIEIDFKTKIFANQNNIYFLTNLNYL